jgi:four helix bundle protein
MTASDLRDRTKAFALRVIALYRAVPRTQEARILCNQLLRAGTSVGANYREAVRARSNAEYVSKLGIVLQELDETRYWLELLAEAGIVSAKRLADLQNKTDQLLAICVTLSKKAGSSPRLPQS